jgi:hypothetical protein
MGCANKGRKERKGKERKENHDALRASPAMLGIRPFKNIFRAKFSYLLFFCNPTHKTETEREREQTQQNSWRRTTNSKPPEPIIMIDQSETEVRSYF